LTNNRTRDHRETGFRHLLAYRETVFLICLGYSKDYEEAEELTQDIYVRVWQKMKSLRPGGSTRGWLITVARNRCVDHVRKRKVRDLFISGRTGPRHSATDENTPENRSILEEDRRRLKQCIAVLPEKFRSVFVLKEYSGLKSGEISELLGISIGTVHSRLNRARRRVKEMMEVHHG